MRIAHVVVVALAGWAVLAPAPARAGDDVAADLAACRDAVKKRSWKKGRDLYLELLETHANNSALIAEKLSIEDDLQLCIFNLGRRKPTAEQLFGSSVKKYSAGSRHITFVFEDGTKDPLWEELTGSYRTLPIRFADKISITAPAEGRKTKVKARIRIRALLSYSPETSSGYLLLPAYRFSWGRTNYDALKLTGTDMSAYHRIFRLGDEPELLVDDYYSSTSKNTTECKWATVSQKGDVLKIEVDGCTKTTVRDKSHGGGYVALDLSWQEFDTSVTSRHPEPPDTPPSLELSGTIDDEYLEKRIANYEHEAFTKWKDEQWVAEDVMPAWLLADQVIESTFEAALPDDVPKAARPLLREFLRRAWAGEIEDLDREIDEIGTLTGEGLHLLTGVHRWLMRAPLQAEAEFDALIETSFDLATAYAWRGSARLSRRDLAGAFEDADTALALAPDDPHAHELRAILFLRRGDLDAASEALRLARERGAWAEDMATLETQIIAARRGPHWKRTYKKTSPHFEVMTDHSAPLAQDVANELEQALRIYTRHVMPLPEQQREARVFVFSSREAYLEYASEVGSSLSHSAGAYLPSLGILVIWMPVDRADFSATVRHEGFHQYLHNYLENVPLWLNEGYAEHFGNADLSRGKIDYDADAFGYARRVGRASSSFAKVESLMRMPRKEFMESASTHYVQAWALVRFLEETEDKDLRGRIDRYVEQLLEGRSQDEAFDAAFKPVINHLQQAFFNYTEDLAPPDDE